MTHCELGTFKCYKRALFANIANILAFWEPLGDPQRPKDGVNDEYPKNLGQLEPNLVPNKTVK